MFALYQSGYAVFGVGETEDQARSNALQWLDNPEDAKTAELLTGPGHSEVHGVLYVRQCTDRLAMAVQGSGGNLPFILKDDGVLDLPDNWPSVEQPW
jgi:hypothetical protein